MEFKIITGHPDYLVSKLGEIFSLKSNRNLKPYKTSKGYLQVRLDGGKTFHVHRLVAEAFIPNPENYPQINHINEEFKTSTTDVIGWERGSKVGKYNGIGACCNGRMKRAYSFIWRYIE